MSRYSRQSFLGPGSEEVYRDLVVAIIGLGGGGSHFAQQFAHLGVGNFRLFDPDRIEESNLNRVVGAKARDVHTRTRKTAIASRLIKGINPAANVKCFNAKWQDAHAWLRDCDAIVGCVDTYVARAELETTARRYLIPYIDIGMDVHSVNGTFVVAGQVIVTMPGGLCMRCLGFLRDELLAEEAEAYGAAGERPQVVWANGTLASIAVGLFTQLFTPWQGAPSLNVYMEYDGNTQTVAPSNRLLYLKDKQCGHFREAEQLGDPFWVPSKVTHQDVPPKGESTYGEGRQENRIS